MYQGTAKIDSNHQNLAERYGIDSSSQASEMNPADKLISTSGLYD